MTARILFLLTLSFTITAAFAQEISENPYSSDIGFNTRFIFEGILTSGSTPFSMMYKKYISENRANRFGLSVNANFNGLTGKPTSSYNDYSSAHIRLSFGREIQKPINEKWIWYYGGDIAPFFEFSRSNIYQSGQLFSKAGNSQGGLELSPFLAIRYNINKRLYLSTEANLNLSYALHNQFIRYPQGNAENGEINSHNFSLSMRPAYGILFFYRF